MASLLQKLLLDLKRRGDWILGELAAVEKGLPADFNTHRKEAAQRLTRSVAWIEHTLRDPDLADPKLEPNFFRDFKFNGTRPRLRRTSPRRSKRSGASWPR